jgi:hypothetical protein
MSREDGWPKPGEVRNPNGRGKGTKNKTTIEMKEFISAVLSENLDRMRDDFDKVSPATRLMLWEKYAKYVLPTLSQTNIAGDVNAKVEVVLKYVDERETPE